MNIHLFINSNANSDTHSTPPPAGQQRHRQSTYLAVREFFLVAMRVFCHGTVSRFTRALARYMRWACLAAASPAAWRRPAVNQILCEAPRADTPTRCAPRNQLFCYASCHSNLLTRTDALCAAKSITLLRSGMSRAVNQNLYTLFSKNVRVYMSSFRTHLQSKLCSAPDT